MDLSEGQTEDVCSVLGVPATRVRKVCEAPRFGWVSGLAKAKTYTIIHVVLHPLTEEAALHRPLEWSQTLGVAGRLTN